MIIKRLINPLQQLYGIAKPILILFFDSDVRLALYLIVKFVLTQYLIVKLYSIVKFILTLYSIVKLVFILYSIVKLFLTLYSIVNSFFILYSIVKFVLTLYSIVKLVFILYSIVKFVLTLYFLEIYKPSLILPFVKFLNSPYFYLRRPTIIILISLWLCVKFIFICLFMSRKTEFILFMFELYYISNPESFKMVFKHTQAIRKLIRPSPTFV